MDETEGLIWLCGQAVKQQIPNKELVMTIDLNGLYALAKMHMLSSIVGISLKKAGVEDARFQKAIEVAQYKTLIMDAEKRKIFQKLDEHKIWHVGLKGSEIQNWYPKLAMRESADVDVLFDASFENDVKEIMLELGYRCECFGAGHHDVYQIESGVCVEMHVALFGVEYDDNLNRYFNGVRGRLVCRNGWEYQFKPEDFYLYFIAHANTHFVNDGVGLRTLLDEYVFLDKHEKLLDWSYVETELHKLKMREFETSLKTLAKKCFGESSFSKDKLSPDELEMLEYLVTSGSHGFVGNRVKNWIRDGGGGFRGKVKYVWRRLFLPMDVVKHWFPFFYRHKILLPFLPVYRMIKGIQGNGKKISAEWKAFRR